MTFHNRRERNKPPKGAKRVGDWVGRKVRSKRDLRNGYAHYPADAIYTVVDAYYGITLEAPPCPHCGVGAYICRVSSDDIEEVE